MKHRSLLLAIVALAVILSASASAGTSSNPLVARSYLDGAFKSDVIAYAERQLTDAETTVNAYLSGSLGGIAPPTSQGYARAHGMSVRVSANGYINLGEGTEFTPNAAVTVAVTSGTLIDITVGARVTNGKLSAAHTYVLPADSYATVRPTTVLTLTVRGWYRIGLADNPFTDVSRSDWFYAAVEYVSALGYFNGTSADKFSPNGTMNRAMFVTVLHRVAGKPAPNIANLVTFTDARDSSAYYYDAMRWASSYGIVTGYEDGTFRPNADISREQLAVMFFRYAQYAGESVSFNPSRAESFPDFAKVASYAKDAFRWACDHGIINGSDGLLKPQANSTRAQVATVVMNYDA
ncbi:MAG: S-layer homology domain-containing protein [Oscillospiraceae bacterium]|jgi:hypothetical protein|nr:S-layer homology domain-containing protein [Oscillospiraceae bacterium]